MLNIQINETYFLWIMIAALKEKKKNLINIKFLKIHSTRKSNWDVELNSHVTLFQP